MGVVRSSVATIWGVLEAMTGHTPEGRAHLYGPLLVAFRACEQLCVSRNMPFDIVLRLSYYGPVDRLCGGPDRYMPATLTWVALDVDEENPARTETYACSFELPTVGDFPAILLAFLRAVLRDLNDPDLTPLQPGSLPTPYHPLDLEYEDGVVP